MKKKIRLTESDLHRIVRESVNRILSEVASDTVKSAEEKAANRYSEYAKKYGSHDPRTLHAANQHDKFYKAWKQDYDNGSIGRKARLLKNQENVKNGKRKYISGKGWRDVGEEHGNEVTESIEKKKK